MHPWSVTHPARPLASQIRYHFSMRWFLLPLSLLASSFICTAEPIHALRFEGLWKLNSPDPRFKLEFQVNGETITATYYHPFPSALSDIHIQGDSFSAWYLDEY